MGRPLAFCGRGTDNEMRIPLAAWMGTGLLPSPTRLGNPPNVLRAAAQSRESVSTKAVPHSVQQGEASSSLAGGFLPGLR